MKLYQALPVFSALLAPILAAPSPLPAGPIAPAATYLILSADISSSFVAGTNPDRDHAPEIFKVTVMGAWPGSMPVECTLEWDAIIANGNNVTTEPFDCSDPSVVITMDRENITPQIGFDISVHQGTNSPAVWRSVSLAQTDTWSQTALGQWHFDGEGGHPIPNGAPSESLYDCLRDQNCKGN